MGTTRTGVITVVVENKMADLSVERHLNRLWSETNGSSPKILGLDCGFSSVEITKRTIGQRNEQELGESTRCENKQNEQEKGSKIQAVSLKYQTYETSIFKIIHDCCVD